MAVELMHGRHLFAESMVELERLVVEVLGDAVHAPLAVVHHHLKRRSSRNRRVESKKRQNNVHYSLIGC